MKNYLATKPVNSKRGRDRSAPFVMGGSLRTRADIIAVKLQAGKDPILADQLGTGAAFAAFAAALASALAAAACAFSAMLACFTLQASTRCLSRMSSAMRRRWLSINSTAAKPPQTIAATKSKHLGEEGEPIKVTFDDGTPHVVSSINRTANRTGAVRVVGRNGDIARWFQKHCQIGDTIEGRILDPHTIRLSVPTAHD